jgi:hypothetical protein
MSKARTWVVAVLAYLAVAVFTFGHCAAHAEPPRMVTYANGVQWREMDSRAFDALGAALVWPLYWSWELQA